MEIIQSKNVPVSSNPGVDSFQLLSPHNSNSKRVTITRVQVHPGEIQDRHAHECSEQIWVSLQGIATLLLEDENTLPFGEGDIVRFEEGDIHGLANRSDEVFQYLAVTSPPINFEKVYQTKRS